MTSPVLERANSKFSRTAESGSSNKYASAFFFSGDSKAKVRPPPRTFFHEETSSLPAAEPAAAAENVPDPDAPKPPEPGRRIDVNSATASELLEVPGLTQVAADAIIAARRAGGLFESAESLARVELGGSNGMIGKKRLNKWLPWLVAIPWHAGGTLRIGCWNLENLADNSTVDKAVNFDCDKWLNSFARTILKHCDLLVLNEVDLESSERLKERLLRHPLIGNNWRWLGAEAPIAGSESTTDTATGIAYLFRVTTSNNHPPVRLLSAPQQGVAEEAEEHLLRNVPLFGCGGLVIAPITVQLTHCTRFEREAILSSKLPAVVAQVTSSWRRRPNVVVLGDWGIDTRGSYDGQIMVKYHSHEAAVPLVPLSTTMSTWQSRNLGSDNIMLPVPLGPWTPSEAEQKACDDANLKAQAEAKAAANAAAIEAKVEAEMWIAASAPPLADGAAAEEPGAGVIVDPELQRPGIGTLTTRLGTVQEMLRRELEELTAVERTAQLRWAAAGAEEKPELEQQYDIASDKRKRIDRKHNKASAATAVAESAMEVQGKAIEKYKGWKQAIKRLKKLEESDVKYAAVEREIREWVAAFEAADEKAAAANDIAEAELALLVVRIVDTKPKAVKEVLPEANADRRFVKMQVVTSGLQKRWSRRMGRAYEDHALLVAEFCCSSGVDTPSIRQIDTLRRMNGFDPDTMPDPMLMLDNPSLESNPTADDGEAAVNTKTDGQIGSLKQWA